MALLGRLAAGLLPILAGGLFTLGLSPFDIWALVPISIGALAWLWWREPERAPLSGFLYGVGFFGAGASWVYVSIHVYGRASPPLAGFLTALFCLGLASLFAIQGMVYRRWMGIGVPGLLAGFPGLWVLFEWLRSWLLTGFPWLYAGYAGLESPLSHWAPVTGVFGLSLMFALIAVLVVYALTGTATGRQRIGRTAIVLIATGGLGIGAWLLGQIAWTAPTAEPLRVALFQPNIPLEEKWDRRNFRRIINQFESSLPPLAGRTDLILWPESAVPAYRHQIESWLADVTRQLEILDAGLITGLPVRADDARYNSIVGIARASGEYHKQKLVPFGEYVPLEAWLRGLIAFFDLPMSQFSPGPGAQSPLRFGELQIAPFICYEVVYPDFVARGSRETDLLITVSNDSWFGRSIGPLQHLQMARFRALETGREMLRGTNNGVTAIIDHRGRIVTQLPQFEVGTLQGEVTPRQGHTPFMRFGSAPVLLLSLAGALLAFRHRH